jgi:outer membrane biosynthesis protein TonB
MKKSLILLAILGLSLSVFAFDYIPKNTESNPFGSKSGNTVQNNQKAEQTTIPAGMREIKTIDEYFRYLPREVQRHWTPKTSVADYSITVEFIVHRDGTISGVRIISTDYPNANRAVLDAVKSGAPYQPLPKSYTKDKVKAQIVLEYRAK